MSCRSKWLRHADYNQSAFRLFVMHVFDTVKKRTMAAQSPMDLPDDSSHGHADMSKCSCIFKLCAMNSATNFLFNLCPCNNSNGVEG